MPVITKPVDINKIWSAAGDILAPSDTKISQGWAVEIPPRQYFNYIDNKQDKSIAHINQYGVALWDPVTEYQFANSGGKSLVMGSNGVVYRAKQTNTNQNPVLDTSNNYWEPAFVSQSDATQVSTAAQSRALTANNVFLSPLQLANAFTGTNQTIGEGQGTQKLPGGLILQWVSFNLNSLTSSGSTTPIVWPTPFPNDVISANFTPDTSATSVFQVSVVNKTSQGANIFCNAYPASTWGTIGANVVFAVGY